MTMVSTQERILTLQWLGKGDLEEKQQEIASFIGTLDERHRRAALVILMDNAHTPGFGDERGGVSLMRSLLSEHRQLLESIRDEMLRETADIVGIVGRLRTSHEDKSAYPHAREVRAARRDIEQATYCPALEMFSAQDDPGIAAILGDTDTTRSEKDDAVEGLKLKEMALRLGVITEDALGPLDWLPFALRRTRLQRALSGDPKDEVLDEQSHGAKRKLLKELVAKEVWKTSGRIQRPSTWDRKSDSQGPQNDSE